VARVLRELVAASESVVSNAPMQRVPRDVSIHLFTRTSDGAPFLMLRRIPTRGGFWQGVTGAPHPHESDDAAAVREVREETGFDVSASLMPLGVEYEYRLSSEVARKAIYAAHVRAIHVVAFGADVTGRRNPTLDPDEHDAFAWCSHREAAEMLDWPVEKDALDGRRSALRELASRLGAH
jgi:8-oxo-dGTP pyrophosphatase MutT (NUDIX family)